MKNFIFIVFLLSFFSSVTAQTTFTRLYGGNGGEEISYIAPTSDGGYILLGESQTFSSGSWDVLLIKTDVNGNQLWSKVYGGVQLDYGNFVKQLADGGYLIVGYTTSYGNGVDYGIYVIRTDNNGNALWSHSYNAPSGCRGIYADVLSNGFMIIGNGYYYASIINNINAAWFLRIDNSGNIIWSKLLSEMNVRGVKKLTDGNYLLSGHGSDEGYAIVKTDTAANPIWAMGYNVGNGDYSEVGSCTTIMQDGSIVFLGSIDSSVVMPDLLLMKTDNTGNVTWAKQFGGSGSEEIDRNENILTTNDNGIVTVGMTLSFGNGSRDGYLNKFDENGNLLWSKAQGGGNDDRCYSVVETSDGSLYSSGFFGGILSHHAFLFKNEANGNKDCNSMNVPTEIKNVTVTALPYVSDVHSVAIIDSIVNTIMNTAGNDTLGCVSNSIANINNEKVIIYPNPTDGKISLESTTPLKSILLTNELGQSIYFDASKTEISLSYIAKGIYVLIITDVNDIIIFNEKIIIQ